MHAAFDFFSPVTFRGREEGHLSSHEALGRLHLHPVSKSSCQRQIRDQLHRRGTRSVSV